VYKSAKPESLRSKDYLEKERFKLKELTSRYVNSIPQSYGGPCYDNNNSMFIRLQYL